jgi:hypothetical protein
VIVASVALVGLAFALLVAGVARGSDAFFCTSIGASAAAALALLVGVRRPPAGAREDDRGPPPGDRGSHRA